MQYWAIIVTVKVTVGCMADWMEHFWGLPGGWIFNIGKYINMKVETGHTNKVPSKEGIVQLRL